MRKCLLCLTLTLCCMNGATISTHARCSNGYDVFGTFAANCGIAGIPYAEIVANPVYQDSVNLLAESVGSPYPHVDGYAEATFIDDYVFTVTGNSGALGLVSKDWEGVEFAPCLSAGTTTHNYTFDSASFGDIVVAPQVGGFAANCFPGGAFKYVPFAFDVPQTFRVSLYSHSSVAGGFASLTDFRFRDALGSPLTNVHYTLVSVGVPEPSTFYLLIASLALLLPLRRSRTAAR